MVEIRLHRKAGRNILRRHLARGGRYRGLRLLLHYCLFDGLFFLEFCLDGLGICSEYPIVILVIVRVVTRWLLLGLVLLLSLNASSTLALILFRFLLLLQCIIRLLNLKSWPFDGILLDFTLSWSLHAKFDSRLLDLDLIGHCVRLVASHRLLLLIRHLHRRHLAIMVSILLVSRVITQVHVLPLLCSLGRILTVLLQVCLPSLLEIVHEHLDSIGVSDDQAIVIDHVVLSAAVIVQVERSIITRVRQVRLGAERLTRLVPMIDVCRDFFHDLIDDARVELVDSRGLSAVLDRSGVTRLPLRASHALAIC